MTIISSPNVQSYELTGLDHLYASVTGQVITPADDAYDKARQTWDLTVDQHPALIVMAAGHDTIREADRSLLIVTSQLTDVHVNVGVQTAWFSAGAKWERILEAVQSVGLARKYRLSADSVNCFELVTTDGQMLNVSAAENADLFWGLRGGGSNFGVVTGMEIRL